MAPMFNDFVAARAYRACQHADLLSRCWPHEMRPLQKADVQWRCSGAISSRRAAREFDELLLAA